MNKTQNNQIKVRRLQPFENYLNSTFGNGNNKKYAVMIVVNQECFSGTMMSHLAGENRILISAAKSNQEAYTEGKFNIEPNIVPPPPPTPYRYWAFIYEGRHANSGVSLIYDIRYPDFIKSLGSIENPESIYYAFEKGYDAATNNYLEKVGGGIIYDGRSNPQINDAAYADKIYI